MTQRRTIWRGLIGAFVLAVWLPAAAPASPIGPGFDLLHTPAGTAMVMLPGIGDVPLMSVPIPGLGNTDTIVKRHEGLSSFPGTIPIEIVALSLKSVQPIPVSDSFFDVFVTINQMDLPGIMRTGPNLPASLGQMMVMHEGPNGGTFDSFFDVFTEITLMDVNFGSHTTILDGPRHIEGQGAMWSHEPTPLFPEIPDFPGGDFYPRVIVHTGPHPVVEPATPEPSTVLLLGSGLIVLAAVKWRNRSRRGLRFSEN